MNKTEMQVVWEFLQSCRDKRTSREIADAIGSKQGNVSSNLTQMVRRNMVVRTAHTWINDNARQQTSYKYTVIGNKYTLKPVTLVPAHPRKSPTPKAAPMVQQELQWSNVPPPAQTTTLTPYGLDTLDIESLTVKQARDLYNKLGAFFGGVK